MLSTGLKLWLCPQHRTPLCAPARVGLPRSPPVCARCPRPVVRGVSSRLAAIWDLERAKKPQPKRAFTPSLVQHIPSGCTFLPRARDALGWAAEAGASTFRSGFQPALQGYREVFFFFFPLFNYIQGSFTGFAIILIAFRADISSAENAIRVPETLRRTGGGEFIWMLLIPLQIVSAPSLWEEDNNFNLYKYIYIYVMHGEL